MSLPNPVRTSNRTQTVGARSGNANVFLVVGLVILAVVVAGGFWLFAQSARETTTDTPILRAAFRGPYEHIVLEQGEVESSNNVEIRCEVRNRSNNSSGPSTSIIEVIDEGTIVTEGDVLVKFDSSGLEQAASTQRITVNSAEALMIQAKAIYDTAVIAKDEYEQGTFVEQRKVIENEIFVAEENLKKAQLSFSSIKRLVARGLLNELQLEGEEFRVDAAQNELDLARQKLDVLQNFTKRKMMTQLESDIKAAEVTWRNEQENHNEELTELKSIEAQIDKCVVRAPQAGQVVYANVRSSRSGSEFVVEPGAAVRERQEIIRLPDPRQMQVNAKISESRINLIREGMPVVIRIDAFGDTTLDGEVVKVNKYAEPGNWWSSSAKEYVTLIKILNPPPSTRVGLTAEVQIHVEHRSDALQLPVQTILERGGKTFCLVQNGDKWDTREVVISSTDDSMVALDESASELIEVGEMVVMNPRKYLDLFDQNRFPAKDEEDDEASAEGEPAESSPTPTKQEQKKKKKSIPSTIGADSGGAR